MNFSEALELIKEGHKLARVGWHGFKLFVYLVPGSEFKVNRAPLNTIHPEGTEVTYAAHIDIRMANNHYMPWTPSQADLLANDWDVVDV
jgi:Protein of unknown function (DUF2829)